MSSMKIHISGNFTTAELLQLLQKVRDIEQDDPDRHYDIFVEAPEVKKEALLDIFQRIKPPLPFLAESSQKNLLNTHYCGRPVIHTHFTPKTDFSTGVVGCCGEKGCCPDK